MDSTPRGRRSRWVGLPVPAPKRKRSGSPFGRQRHYGAVELAGAGEQVNVNDVVEITENKPQQETWQRHPPLVQVLSMWEDTFTGIFKFRARWLVQASDLPAASLPQLRTSGQAFPTDCIATGGEPAGNTHQHGADDVFLTKRVNDLEVRSIVKPITLCVSTSATTASSPGKKGNMGPRLTHEFCDTSGDFRPLEGTEPILRRARVRQANAVALATRADEQNRAATSGKQIVESNGWLLPKRGSFQRRGRRYGACRAEYAVDIAASSSNSTEISSFPPSIDVGASDDSGTEESLQFSNVDLKEGEDDKHDDGTISDSSRDSEPILSVGEGFTPRKSGHQRKSQRSPPSHSAPVSDSEVRNAPTAQVEDSSKAQAEVYAEEQVEEYCEANVEDSPRVRVKDRCEAQLEDYSEREGCPPLCASALTSRRRCRVSSNERLEPLPPRSRRLAMPPTAEEASISLSREMPPRASGEPFAAVTAARPVRISMSTGLRPKSTLPLTRGSWMEDVHKSPAQLSTAAKRKRSRAATTTSGENRCDYPPGCTPVGKHFQADIPGLLSAEEMEQPHTGTGARMVWRSNRDWDPKSRGLLAGYLHAAKAVVAAKQARPGVAVHVRMRGQKGSTGADEEVSTGIAGTSAVWAISSGRDACGLVRVACSKTARTYIPKSAIQGVQSQEQALAALVKVRCALGNFTPALQSLAIDQGSPESLQPWTLKQVNALEKALLNHYDPSRKLGGWDRPGMAVDREDFIDLATVSKQVPGKTPTQVLSFYYKYLATAEPLTDVVFGAQAAKARKLDSVSVTHAASAVLPGSVRLMRDNAHTAKPNASAKQVPPALRRENVAETAGNATEPAPKPKPQVVRPSAPKPAGPVAMNAEPNVGTTADKVTKHNGPTNRGVSPFVGNGAVSSAPEAPPTAYSPTAFRHATNKRMSDGATNKRMSDGATNTRMSGGVDCPAKTNRGADREVDGQSVEGGGRGGASHYLAQHRRSAVGEKGVSRVLPPVRPADVEVLEVEDSDDVTPGGATRKYGIPQARSGEPRRPSDTEAAARHVNSMEPAGLPGAARHMSRQVAPTAAPMFPPAGVLPLPSRSASCHTNRVEVQRTGGFKDARNCSRSDVPGLSNAQREPRSEQPPMSLTSRSYAHVRHLEDRPSGGHVESGDIPSNGVHGPRYDGRGNGKVESEPASPDDMFGSMAPCWRLLQRAEAYMDKDQLEYMRTLILTHVRKPMSRDQLLERAKSCLQEQDKIFAAFVKMIDRIDQPPQMPFYPKKRAPHVHPQSASCSVRRSTDAGAISTSPRGPHPPRQLAPPLAYKAQKGVPNSRRTVNDGGERGVPMSTPSQPRPQEAAPAASRVEARRLPHPHGHNGAGGCRASGVGTSGNRGAVSIRAEPPPHLLSPGPHPSDVPVSPSGYLESRSNTGHGGGARVRKSWPQQPPGEWKNGKGSSAAVAATAPGSMPGRGGRGPAWGGGAGGAWS